MIQMDPTQSWILVILLAILVATFIWVVKEIDEQRTERDLQALEAAETESDSDEQLAPVIELRPAERARHLTVVTDSRHESPKEIYDWRVKGL